MTYYNLKAGTFLTRVLGNHSFGDLVVTETYYAPGQKLEMHSHSQSAFIVVLKGRFVDQHESETHECQSCDVIYRPAQQMHSDRFGNTSTTCLNIQFGDHWFSRLQEITKPRVSDALHLFSNLALFELGRRVYGEFRRRDEDSSLIVEGLTLEMIGVANRIRFGKLKSGAPLWLKGIRDRLHSEFSGKVSIQALAEEAGVHPVYLNRAFRKQYGQSVGEYLRSCRMKFSASELASSSKSIAEISHTSGFSDQAHFCRVFKRAFGVTPLAYRKFFRPDVAKL